MEIIQKRKWFFAFSGGLLFVSLFCLFVWGLKPGIDFTGGVLMEYKFVDNKPSNEDLRNQLEEFNLGSLTVQETGTGNFLLRFVSEQDELNQKVQNKIADSYAGANLEKLEFINSSISSELKKNAFVAVTLSVIAILVYIAWAFKKVSFPVSSWSYGTGAILALVHDVIITLGVFSVLGKFYNVEVNIPFIAALLTILGYSVNDTIVIFDRVRENLGRAGAKKDFENTVNNSIIESLGRSINTSITVVFVLLAIIFFGGESIKYFSLALLVGIVSGTYSSIFVASAYLVEVYKRKIKKV